MFNVKGGLSAFTALRLAAFRSRALVVALWLATFVITRLYALFASISFALALALRFALVLTFGFAFAFALRLGTLVFTRLFARGLGASVGFALRLTLVLALRFAFAFALRFALVLTFGFAFAFALWLATFVITRLCARGLGASVSFALRLTLVLTGGFAFVLALRLFALRSTRITNRGGWAAVYISFLEDARAGALIAGFPDILDVHVRSFLTPVGVDGRETAGEPFFLTTWATVVTALKGLKAQPHHPLNDFANCFFVVADFPTLVITNSDIAAGCFELRLTAFIESCSGSSNKGARQHDIAG